MPIAQDKTYWVYVTASKPHGVLYVGMTSDLAGRTWEHRERVDGWFHQALLGCLARLFRGA